MIDVSLVVTFHSEGILANLTLNSIERCRLYAEKRGIKTEYVWVLDSVEDETKRILMQYIEKNNIKNLNILEVNHRDLGMSRNSGISAAHGKAIATLDGDDYYSANWIERAWMYLQEYGEKSILHPEVVVSFGIYNVYYYPVDQTDKKFDSHCLLSDNFWTSWTFANRSIYLNCPYHKTSPLKTGFGYEDWHWNCETIAYGYVHRIVPKTVVFYRRKQSSLVTITADVNAIIPPSKLFEKTPNSRGNL